TLAFLSTQGIRRFLIQYYAIQHQTHGADGVRDDLSRNPVRPVVADDADDVATTKPEFDQAERQVAHPHLIVVPGEHAPESEVLFPQRDFVAVFAGVEAQQLRKGIGVGEASGVVHHAADSAGWGLSSGSTSTSSSSPR